MTTELGFRLPAPTASKEDVDRIIEILRGRGWMTASLLHSEFGWGDRDLRACAEASEGRILSGQKGYRYFDASTPLDDADHAASWLESQGKKMLARAQKIRVRYHRFARENVA